MDVCPVCDGTGSLLQDPCPLCDGKAAASLAELSEEVLERLRRNKPITIADMDPSLHYFAPHVRKVTWDALGDLVSGREKSTRQHSISGEHWISLRLDGSGFSKAVRQMRRLGVLESEGFSDRFAQCMRSCLRHLMEEFHAVLGFTQSDEMILFLKPTSVIRGERQVHFHNGRVQKLATLAASLCTAKFIMELSELCLGEGKGLDGLAKVLPHFDCRIGYYESWQEARALLMWRAYDCSVNGVSDAVYHTKGSGKVIMGKGKVEKAEWLWKNGLLPLPTHQAYGHLLVRVAREVQGYNPKLQEVVATVRQVIEPLQGPVLELMRTDRLGNPSRQESHL
eukprot:TRINITY_DN73517_c0_g1_i1.p1 TRINITY_DN73517_c0_g1~~TRINITY_DN73517_c0_g1_i1.p1  ORF type:complete len:359 (+),score=74.73 TRINITY_DN73517_c0_g1_i1:66-1079(+)